MQPDIAHHCESTHSVVHHEPDGISDRIALAFTRTMRFCADTFFAKRYGRRAIVLETVAAVPGMVGATMNHLKARCDNPDRTVAPCPPHVEGSRQSS